MKQSFEKASLPSVIEALAFSARKHSRQRRKDADQSPYINHPIALVSILALEAKIDDPDALCAALLHDTIEDSQTTSEELSEIFGSTIASIVIEVSDDKNAPQLERKRLQVEHAPLLSPKAKLVELADKIANLRDVAECPPPDWSLTRRQEYFDWAKEVIDAISDVPPLLSAVFEVTYARRP